MFPPSFSSAPCSSPPPYLSRPFSVLNSVFVPPLFHAASHAFFLVEINEAIPLALCSR